MRTKANKLWLIVLTGLMAISLMNCGPRVIYVRKAPPPVRVEVRPAKPFPTAVWISGYWRWNGTRYVWVAGRWVRPRRGYAWVPGHWRHTRHGWRWVPGHWKRIR